MLPGLVFIFALGSLFSFVCVDVNLHGTQHLRAAHDFYLSSSQSILHLAMQLVRSVSGNYADSEPFEYSSTSTPPTDIQSSAYTAHPLFSTDGLNGTLPDSSALEYLTGVCFSDSPLNDAPTPGQLSRYSFDVQILLGVVVLLCVIVSFVLRLRRSSRSSSRELCVDDARVVDFATTVWVLEDMTNRTPESDKLVDLTKLIETSETSWSAVPEDDDAFSHGTIWLQSYTHPRSHSQTPCLSLWSPTPRLSLLLNLNPTPSQSLCSSHLPDELDVDFVDIAPPDALSGELDLNPATVALPAALPGELDLDPADVALPAALHGELDINLPTPKRTLRRPADVALPSVQPGELDVDPDPPAPTPYEPSVGNSDPPFLKDDMVDQPVDDHDTGEIAYAHSLDTGSEELSDDNEELFVDGSPRFDFSFVFSDYDGMQDNSAIADIQDASLIALASTSRYSDTNNDSHDSSANNPLSDGSQSSARDEVSLELDDFRTPFHKQSAIPVYRGVSMVSRVGMGLQTYSGHATFGFAKSDPPTASCSLSPEPNAKPSPMRSTSQHLTTSKIPIKSKRLIPPVTNLELPADHTQDSLGSPLQAPVQRSPFAADLTNSMLPRRCFPVRRCEREQTPALEFDSPGPEKALEKSPTLSPRTPASNHPAPPQV
ncbi:hypothetical protein DFH11DRAFT_1813734 [Phellopilus nigrolimitatus]|nr:hypothetical protein DFH11DRAFT_1813734 [Phellopilus nigrolimitatus]